MYTPIIPTFMRPGRHGKRPGKGAFGKRRTGVREFLAALNFRKQIPSKHWSAKRLEQAGLKKVRHWCMGKRSTLLVPLNPLAD